MNGVVLNDTSTNESMKINGSRADADSVLAFHLETYRWLGRNVNMEFLRDHTLVVLPIEEFFPNYCDYNDEQAKEVFQLVKRYAGIEDWAARLEKFEESANQSLKPIFEVCA